jgi:hypothetical protein
MSATIHAKDESTLAVWRVGLVAYRDARRRELREHECCNAGKAAILAAYPAISREEASAAIVNAVAWASVHHHNGCIVACRAANGSGQRIIAASGISGIRGMRMREGAPLGPSSRRPC